MASTSDIRDIMALGPQPQAPPPKKKKRVEPQPRLTGVTREVQMLMGDSVPPVHIVEQKVYKSKPSLHQRAFKPRHWEDRPFIHGGRTDGLVLRHWKRAIPHVQRPQTQISTPTDVEMTDVNAENKEDSAAATPIPTETKFEDEFPSEKWNVAVQTPTYTDTQYLQFFQSDDWTREETDYLLTLCSDYDLRWILIADRFDPSQIPRPPNQSEQTNGDTEKKTYPDRTMESIKARYYQIAAQMMSLHTPPPTMTANEFTLYERMRNFNPTVESTRKTTAEALFRRTKDEADEELVLLSELARITRNEEESLKLRRDLYARLESAPAIRRTERGEEQSTAMYQTSQGLSILLQNLLAKERKLKRPMAPNGEQPTSVDPRRGSGQPNQYSRRESTMTEHDTPIQQKKGSMSTPAAPVVRQLSPQEELKFGVSHPSERVTSGVQFRHEKINRLTMAKSQVQTSKIQAALTELGVPGRLLMPTERVCREFERLVGAVNLLLDARKVKERVAGEVKILEEVRRARLGLPKEGEEPELGAAEEKMEVDTSQVDTGQVMDESRVEDEDAGGEDDEQDQSKMSVDEKAKEDEDADAEGEEDEDEKDEEPDAAAEEDEENDQSFAEPKEDEEDEDEEGEEEEQDSEDEGLEALRKSAAADDEEDEANEDEAEADVDAEEDEEVEDEEAAAESDAEGSDNDNEDEEGGEEAEDDDAEGEAEPEVEASRPSSSHSAVISTRARKRSASVISDASKTGSNRSGLGRKKRR